MELGQYRVNIVMEYCDGGDLKQYIEQNRPLQSKVRFATSWLAPIVALLLGCIAQLLGMLPLAHVARYGHGLDTLDRYDALQYSCLTGSVSSVVPTGQGPEPVGHGMQVPSELLPLWSK